MIIKRFKDNGFQINRKTKRGRASKLSNETQEYLLKRETLVAWAPFSLRERCRLLRFQRNEIISQVNLRKFYIRNNIKYYGIANYKLAKKTEEERLGRLSYEYAIAIARAKMEGRDIFYVDQTTFNVWMSKKKTWQPKRDRLECYQKDTRGSGLTLYGAITERQGLFYYGIYNTTNKANFESFVNTMVFDKANFQGSVIVLDNHSSHRSKETQETVNQLGAEIMYLPPYHSHLNPIETLWALIKNEWRKRVMVEAGNIDKEQPVEFLRDICEYTQNYNIKRLVVKVNHLLIKILKK